METIPHKAVSHISVLDIHSKKHAQKRVVGRDFYTLSYRISGIVTLKANGTQVISTPNTVTFTPKGMSYLTEIREDTHMIAIHFRLVEDVDIRTPFVFSAAGTDLGMQFQLLKESYRISSPLDFECMALFYRLLSAIERIGSAHNAPPACAAQARMLLDARFSDANLSVAEIAREIGVSDSYLRRSFRAAYGEAPIDCLCRLRVRHAKDLLQSEFYTVAEIGTRCGFHSTGYFIQSFRAQTGETPNAYRRRQRKTE